MSDFLPTATRLKMDCVLGRDDSCSFHSTSRHQRRVLERLQNEPEVPADVLAAVERNLAAWTAGRQPSLADRLIHLDHYDPEYAAVLRGAASNPNENQGDE